MAWQAFSQSDASVQSSSPCITGRNTCEAGLRFRVKQLMQHTGDEPLTYLAVKTALIDEYGQAEFDHQKLWVCGELEDRSQQLAMQRSFEAAHA